MSQATLPEIDLAASIEAVLHNLLRPIVEMERIRRKEYLTEEEVVSLFGLSVATLRTKRSRGGGPVYVKDGVKVLYRRSAVSDYLAARQVKRA